MKNNFRMALFLAVLAVMSVSCNQGGTSYQEDLERGRTIREASFKTLSSEVKAALERGGVEEAVSYCHIQASPLVDSLSRAYRAEVSRTSFHYRNPANQPTEKEEPLLVAYKQHLLSGQTLTDTVIYYDDGVTTYYSPIVIESPLCLTCHGNPGTTMSTDHAELLRTLYPEDNATGYETGDLRGMWVIELKEGTD